MSDPKQQHPLPVLPYAVPSRPRGWPRWLVRPALVTAAAVTFFAGLFSFSVAMIQLTEPGRKPTA